MQKDITADTYLHEQTFYIVESLNENFGLWFAWETWAEGLFCFTTSNEAIQAAERLMLKCPSYSFRVTKRKYTVHNEVIFERAEQEITCHNE